MNTSSAITGLVVLGLVLGVAAIARPKKSETSFSGTAAAVDGDTLKIAGRSIRLHGIDAPEFMQECTLPDGVRWPCGVVAAMRLADLISDKIIVCEKRDTDRYLRTVATCFAGPLDLSAEMVTQGYALAYVRYSKNYILQEKAAQLAKAGIWSGTFTNPETYRRERAR